MIPTDREALQGLLSQMRAVYASLSEQHAGICILHLEAAIAALEGHLEPTDAPLNDLAPPQRASARDCLASEGDRV